MIVTLLSNISRYRGLSKNLDAAIDWLKAGAWRELPLGKYQIQGDDVFALVQEYATKEPSACRFEAHRKYTDIQMLVTGREKIEVTDVASLQVQEPYKPDIEFYSVPKRQGVQSLEMEPELAAIFFPEDAHRPSMRIADAAETVKKVVVKVAI